MRKREVQWRRGGGSEMWNSVFCSSSSLLKLSSGRTQNADLQGIRWGILGLIELAWLKNSGESANPAHLLWPSRQIQSDAQSIWKKTNITRERDFAMAFPVLCNWLGEEEWWLRHDVPSTLSSRRTHCPTTGQATHTRESCLVQQSRCLPSLCCDNTTVWWRMILLKHSVVSHVTISPWCYVVTNATLGFFFSFLGGRSALILQIHCRFHHCNCLHHFQSRIYIFFKYTVEVGSLHIPQPNTFKLSFSQFLTIIQVKIPWFMSVKITTLF